jgi:phage regulator Rha-like protein
MNLEQKSITSMEVSEMMEVRHGEILRKLDGDKKVKGIIPTLTEHNFAVSNYFQESTYQDLSGKENRCYLVTKMGCDFLANKFTGEKGILFSARYVKKFREMEEAIKKPRSTMEILELELQAIKEVEEKIESVNDDLQIFKKDMPILALEMDRITTAVRSKGVNCLCGKSSVAYSDKSLRGRVYSDIYGQLKREFAVGSYKAIKRNQTDLAVSIINNYTLPMTLENEIENCNAQMELY